jgi:glycerol-3-phosphate dehydrogenase (NAD(P)+)
MTKVAVIGAGSWGTTLANLLAAKGEDVHLWVREAEVLQQIREEGTNELFLPGVKLSPRLKAVDSFAEALSKKEVALLVVPSHVYREVMHRVQDHLEPNTIVVAATKGIENETLMLMSQVTEEVLGASFAKTFCTIAGPSFAKEVSSGHPTAVTLACRDPQTACRMQRLFATDYFRVYMSSDVIGVQLGGALKNVVALAAGAADGMGFGHNARAALITRGLAEMTRLGLVLDADPLTFAGLAGLGDLVLTCTGDLSRNRSVGIKIGRGLSLEEIVGRMQMVAEGVKTTRSAFELAGQMAVEMPITEQMYEILYNRKNPREVVKALMSRGLKAEKPAT